VQLADDWTIARGYTGGSERERSLFEDLSQSRDASEIISLFPCDAVLAPFKDELTGFKTSRGTVQFPLDKRLPIALTKRILNARVAGHGAKARR
jgi:hypothetical protein